MTQSTGNHRVARNGGLAAEAKPLGRLWHRLRGFLGARNGDHSLRETIEEIIEEISEEEEESTGPIGADERVMLANILKLRHLTAYDVMVPRADIVAVDSDTGLDELIEVTHRFGHSRVPVYRESLDDVAGLVHIKDLLPYAKGRKNFNLAGITRTVLFVAPSMRILDLLLEMRLKRVHMALVVDEFGGVDGLTTIEDLVEEIVGEIEDEHDVAELPKLVDRPDGSLIADARTTVEEFEERVGPFLSKEERDEDIDTLGGLVFYLADAIPGRGELILHPSSGITFEVMEADPRRIKRLRVRNLSSQSAAEADG
jgi:CBS domain containing-hemolysin-like protein